MNKPHLRSLDIPREKHRLSDNMVLSTLVSGKSHTGKTKPSIFIQLARKVPAAHGAQKFLLSFYLSPRLSLFCVFVNGGRNLTKLAVSVGNNRHPLKPPHFLRLPSSRNQRKALVHEEDFALSDQNFRSLHPPYAFRFFKFRLYPPDCGIHRASFASDFLRQCPLGLC